MIRADHKLTRWHRGVPIAPWIAAGHPALRCRDRCRAHPSWLDRASSSSADHPPATPPAKTRVESRVYTAIHVSRCTCPLLLAHAFSRGSRGTFRSIEVAQRRERRAWGGSRLDRRSLSARGAGGSRITAWRCLGARANLRVHATSTVTPQRSGARAAANSADPGPQEELVPMALTSSEAQRASRTKSSLDPHLASVRSPRPFTTLRRASPTWAGRRPQRTTRRPPRLLPARSAARPGPAARPDRPAACQAASCPAAPCPALGISALLTEVTP